MLVVHPVMLTLLYKVVTIWHYPCRRNIKYAIFSFYSRIFVSSQTVFSPCWDSNFRQNTHNFPSLPRPAPPTLFKPHRHHPYLFMWFNKRAVLPLPTWSKITGKSHGRRRPIIYCFAGP